MQGSMCSSPTGTPSPLDSPWKPPSLGSGCCIPLTLTHKFEKSPPDPELETSVPKLSLSCPQGETSALFPEGLQGLNF